VAFIWLEIHFPTDGLSCVEKKARVLLLQVITVNVFC
jgi:hypothetical protein